MHGAATQSLASRRCEFDFLHFQSVIPHLGKNNAYIENV